MYVLNFVRGFCMALADSVPGVSGGTIAFIIASIPLIVKSEYKILSENKKNIMFLLIGIIVVFSMTYFNPIASSGENLSLKFENLNISFIVYIFISGLIAV